MIKYYLIRESRIHTNSVMLISPSNLFTTMCVCTLNGSGIYGINDDF